MLLALPRFLQPSYANGKVTVLCSLLHKTLPQYASFDMDWWHNTTGSGGDWGNASILYADLANSRLNAVVKVLSPAFLRIGGSQVMHRIER